MSQTINVAYVAELARIALTPEETAQLQSDLDTIVGYVRKIGELDVSGIEPTLYGQATVNAFREDAPVPPAIRERALDNAPARNGLEFRLPKIVEDA